VSFRNSLPGFMAGLPRWGLPSSNLGVLALISAGALATSLSWDAGVKSFGAEGVCVDRATPAVRPHACFTTPDVLTTSHGLDVCRVAASSHATEVVEGEPFGDWSHHRFVEKPVGVHELSIDSHLYVAVCRCGAVLDPTERVEGTGGEEHGTQGSRDGGFWFWSAWHETTVT